MHEFFTGSGPCRPAAASTLRRASARAERGNGGRQLHCCILPSAVGVRVRLMIEWQNALPTSGRHTTIPSSPNRCRAFFLIGGSEAPNTDILGEGHRSPETEGDAFSLLCCWRGVQQHRPRSKTCCCASARTTASTHQHA